MQVTLDTFRVFHDDLVKLEYIRRYDVSETRNLSYVRNVMRIFLPV